MRRLFVLWIALTPLAGQTEEAHTLVQRLLEQYAQIESVSCDIRRDITATEGSIRWLSRVYFQRGDRLHVENFAPLPRLIIADGSTMHQHNEDQPRGFRRPIADLTPVMQAGLRRVPGTWEEHLFRLRDKPEIELEGSGDFPIWRAYETPTVYAVLQVDDAGRLGRLQLFDANDRTRLTGELVGDAFEEVADGVWIPMVHRAHFQVGDTATRERIRFSNYAVNEPIDEQLFKADSHFPDTVEWVDQFEDL